MPNKKKLYQALKAEGYDNFADESAFNAYVDNADNRKKLFSALKAEGYDNFADEKSFDEYLGYSINQPEDDAVFEANAERFRNGQPTEKVTTQSMIDAHPELGLGEQSYQYKPEVQQRILQNKPDMFKPKQSLMDAPLGVNAPEGSDEKFQARINVVQKNLQDPEYQKSKVKSEFRVLSDSVDADLEKIEDAITSRQKAARNINWKPGMPSSRDDAKLAELRGQRTYLEGAKELIEDSQNILNAVEAEKDGSFFGGLGRGIRDKAFDIDTWTMGLSDLVGGLRLKSVLEKAEKGETLTPAEQKLLDASVNNMAVNFYYRNDLGLGYQAGEITGQSIPFMLEFLVNPVSASGNAMAKRLLTYGLKRFGSAVNSKAIKAGTRLATDALAAGGVTATTGMGHVLSGGIERLNKNYEYGLDEEGNLNVVNTHNMGVGEAFAKSATSAFLERQSEMIFNAFRGAPSLFKGIETSLPGGVNTFMNYVRNSRLGELWKGIKNNATMKELAKRTQFHGLGEEYLEEVYNNFANIPLGEMTFEEATDLENNIVTFLGLAPTQVMFSAIGGVGYGVERYKAKRDLERTFGKMNEEQKRKLMELQEMGKLSTNKDIAFFLAETIKDESLTPEQKRAEIEYAYNLAKQNAIDEVSNTDLEDTIESENVAIDAVTNIATGEYIEVDRWVLDGDTGVRVPQPGYIVGWIGEAPVFVPEGMENAEENRIVLKPNEWNPETVQRMPAEEVKALNEEMIREEAARQAEREAKYAPEVLSQEMQQGIPFETEDAIYVPISPTLEGNGWVVEVQPKGVDNKSAARPFTEELTNDQFHDLLQALLDAQEAAQAEAVKVEESNQSIVEGLEAKPMEDGTGRVMQPKGVQGNEVVYDITDGNGTVLEEGSMDAAEYNGVGESVGEQVNAPVNNVTSGENVSEQVNDGVNVSVNNENVQPVAEGVATKPQAEVKPQTPVIPTKEDGSIDFVSYGKEGTFKALGEKYGEKMPNKVAVTAKALVDDLAKAKKKLDKAIEDYDNAPIGREEKAEKARDKAQQEFDAIKREADFWAEMDTEIKDAQFRRASMLNPQAETETSNEPMNADEFVAQQLSAGNIVLNKEDYKRETGYGDAEANAMNGGTAKMFGENGMTIQEAGERLMEMDRENGTNFFDQSDSNAGRDALISLLGSVKSRKELNQYIENNRAEQAKKESEGLRNELERSVMDANYASLEDYVLQMEASEMENPFSEVNADEILAIFAEAVEEYNNYLNPQENGQGTTEETIEGNGGLLSEEQSGDTGGTEVRQESARNGERAAEESETADAATEVELKQQEGETTLQFAERAAEENRRRPLRKRAEEWSKALGVDVIFVERLEDVDSQVAYFALMDGEKVSGWYEGMTGKVYFYMPNLDDISEVDKTYIHEVVAHKGLKEMLGKERFDELCDKVWDMMPSLEKAKFIRYPGVKGNTRAAADEYIAHLAEKEDLTPEEMTMWDRVVKAFRDIFETALNAIIGKVKLTDEDISNLIKASYANLKSGAEGGADSRNDKRESGEDELVNSTRFRTTKEEQSIIDKAKSDGTYMLAPNGEPTNLTEKQWAQVRTEAFKKWFGDWENDPANASKVVDENGEPLVMVHNSTTSGITEFKPNVGNAIFFADKVAQKYVSGFERGENDYKVFLNIKNPHTESYEAAFIDEDEGIDGVFVTAEVDEGVGHAAIVKNPNQIKSATDNVGTFDEGNNDIRFRVVKDKNELVAVHNISEENLRKVLEVGGLIMPSIAITKADMGHEGYGEISLLFDKETINPTDRRNKVYGGDAWTPRFPSTTAKINDKVSSKVYKKIKELIDDRSLKDLYSLSAELHADNIERTISDRGVEGYYNKEWMKLAYLLDNGKKVKIPMKMKDYGDMSEKILEMVKEKGLKASDIQDGGYKFYQDNADIVEAVKRIEIENKLQSFPEEKRDALEKLLNEKEMTYSRFDSLISSARRMEYDLENGGLKKIIDRAALRESIEKKVKTNNADYNKWVDSLFDGIVEKYGIRNNRDWYTPSGNLRPWEQLYDNATPANILKHMLAENEQGGSGGFFDSNIMGASAETYESIEEIREKGKKRLRRLEDSEYDEWSNSISERMSEICNDFLSPSQRKEFGAAIDAKIDITNAVAKDKTADGIYKAMKRKYPGFKKEHAKKVEEIVKEIQDFAIGYFEAKPRRIVPLSEVRKAIVPKKTSSDIVEGLKNNGIEVATYKNGDEAARARLIKKESNGIRFRISNRNQEIFVSNAQKAVEGIKQEKGTPQQWLAMIEKNSGLKAGEDKWLGLSDWLKGLDKKSVTKDEILEFIGENKIQIEEVHYEEGLVGAYKDDFEDAFWTNYVDGTLQNVQIKDEDLAYEWYKEQTGKELKTDENGRLTDRSYRKIEDYANETIVNKKTINSVRMDYTTSGLVNNHEIALTVPTIEPWNENDDIHFGDAGEGRAIAWIRFGETTIEDKNLTEKSKILGSKEWWNMTEEERKSVMNELKELKQNSKPSRVLVIDEIQSKRHQEGRERGYNKVSFDDYTIGEYKKQGVVEVASIYSSEGREIGWISKDKYGYTAETEELLPSGKFATEKEAVDSLKGRYKGIPEAPFEKNWSELAFKRMLRYAAENGFDKVAWTTGMQQAERYNIGGVVSSINYFLRGDGAYRVETYGSNGYQIDSIPTEFKDGQALAEVFGKELATNMVKDLEEDRANVEEAKKSKKELRDKMRELDDESAEYEALLDEFSKYDAIQSKADEGHSISGDGLRIGGEGMKAFYDKILPSFVNKYVKKWGTKVQDIELPNVEESGRIMHSVDVTDAMKESVMEGQTMFRISEKGKQIQAEVDKFSSKYNSKETIVAEVSSMSDKEIEDIFNSPADEVRKAMDEGLSGGYNLLNDKIYIFVDNQSLDELEETMFHENVHPLFNGNDMIGAFDEAIKNNTKKMRASLKERGYREDEIAEEVFVRIATDALLKGDFKNIEKYLPEEYKGEFYNKLKDFGYDRVKEESIRRGQGNVRSDISQDKKSQTSEEVAREGGAGQYVLSGRRDTGRSYNSENGSNGSERKALEEGSDQAERLGKLFDQVADMGLEGVLENKAYTSMMVDIYKALPEAVRTEIADDAIRLYGGSVAPAVSDYIGVKSKESIIDKIVTIVREALRKVGFDLDLNANEVRYLAWRSKKPLDRNNLLEVAEDIDMKNRLKVGEYDGTTPDGGGTRFRASEDILNQIKQARREVEKAPSEAQKEAGNYKKGHISLDGFEITLENPKGGTRSGVDKNGKKWSVTMNNDYGYIRGTEAVDGDHIDVFLSDNPTEGRVFVVDQSNEEGTFDESKVMYGFNSLDEARNAYLSNYEKGWEKRIMDITEVSKDEFKKWIDSSHKKTKAFSEYKSVKSENNDIRFRVGGKLNVRDEYEATIKKGGYQAREAVQDAMLSLRKFQEFIEKATGKKIRDFENAWMHENRLSSVVQAEIHDMERKFYKPMMDAVKKLMNAANLEQEEVADYLMLKHGIERNREMAVRKALTDDQGKIDRTQLEQWYQEKQNIRNDASLDTWRKKQEAMDNAALMYGADMSRDYSGLTSMFGTDDLADSTQKAYDEVEALENAHPLETESLGKAIKAMTQSSLDKAFESGLMDRKVYNELTNDMYDYYIPLRGFDETTSEEVYAYLDQDRGAFNAPLVRAKGRSSKSDNPIAYLKSIAESGIMQGNRNKMKQSFLNMVMNNTSDLVSVREGVWAIFNPASGEWEAATPSTIPNNATPADVEAAMEAWEQQMEQAAQSDPTLVKKVAEAADVPYRVVGNRMNQHQVIVKRLGKSYTLTINGNPRLAMALNGQTNPNNTSNDGKVAAYVSGKIDALNRTLSAWYTTRNPDFVASNFMRDTFYTNTIVRAKEGNAYANKFHKNYAKLLKPGKMINLFRKYENGTLDASNKTEAAFLDFMMNGGETGYSNLKDLEHIKKQIAEELKGNKLAKLEKVAEKLDILNRAVENTARFAAYLTSRQEGRSIAKSIFDAKEISVNFNKKGAGGTFFGMTGQTKLGNLGAMVGAGGRAFYVFFNAAIQGTTNLMHVMKVNPKGTSAGVAAMFLMGAVVPMLFAGDDDEKDYYDLPEHVRRNHLIIPGTGDAWVSIPLPIEYRIMYGMGELLTSWRTGHERGSDIARKMLNLTGQALPLNFLEEGFDAFIPSALSPIWQVYNNKSWTGLPIYKDTEFNKDDPEYTKAYKNVDRLLYNFSKSMYEWTFDEENQKARVDLNPAVMESLARGYFGGLATQLSNLGKTWETIAGEREFDWRSIPIGNRVFKSGDERTKEKRITNEYFENMEKLEFLQARERLLKKTINGVEVPEMDKEKAKIDDEIMRGSEVYQKYMEFKKLKKTVDKIRKTIKEKGSNPELEKALSKAQEEANKAVR